MSLGEPHAERLEKPDLSQMSHVQGIVLLAEARVGEKTICRNAAKTPQIRKKYHKKGSFVELRQKFLPRNDSRYARAGPAAILPPVARPVAVTQRQAKTATLQLETRAHTGKSQANGRPVETT